MKYYSLSKIKKYKADYNIIMGERSNGKSYALKKEALELYKKTGKATVWLRRWDKDITRNTVGAMFSGLKQNGEFKRIFGDDWENVHYKNHSFYLTRYDEEKKEWIDSEKPIIYVFALNNWEHDKDSQLANLGMVVFDEFMTRGFYLVNEFVIFCNVLSTFIRDRGDVSIYMVSNTVSKNCPYFDEMGLENVWNQPEDTIDIYSFGEKNELRIAVEHTEHAGSKPSDKYFAFNNPALRMITSGDWELAIYPHLPFKNDPDDLVYTFIVKSQKKLLQGELYSGENGRYLYIHRKTGEIHKKTLVFDAKGDNTQYSRRSLKNPITPVQRAIYDLVRADMVYYQSNVVGELFNDYLKNCRN